MTMNKQDLINTYSAVSDSTEKTESLGRALAALISSDNSLPRFVAMYGDLGVGKTAFVRGFCSDICSGIPVRSPTFALVNDYRSQCATIRRVYHFDMYRITGEDDLYSIGFYDYLRPDAICISEWCELIPYALPDEYIRVEIEKTDNETERRITVNLIGD